MRTLHSRMKPMMYFCHLYGMGFSRDDIRIVYFLFVSVNMSASVYIYYSTAAYVKTHMMEMFELSTVMSVIRLHFRFLAHPSMIMLLSAKKTTILNYIGDFDDIVYGIDGVSLKPYMIHFFGWLTATVVAEFVQLMTFHYRTDFKYFFTANIVQFVGSNVWLVTPVLMYIFLISLVSRGIRNINDGITSIGKWRAHSDQWKQLQHVGIVLADSVFGAIIIIFIVVTIMDITFFCFITYLCWMNGFPHEVVAYTAIMFVRAGLMLQLFRTSHGCKAEKQMKKTKILLNGTDKSKHSDYKEFQFTSLYMMHSDFSFMPCHIFDITYRNLATIFATIAAYSTFQIQMKPLVNVPD